MSEIKTTYLWFLNICIALSLLGCNAKKEISSTPATPKPSWVLNRPVTNLDYIGIGFSKKAANSNFIETAKKNALGDLASEIKVNLESSTVYKQTEIDGKYQDNFKSTIKTTSIADIEGYELVDSWQSEDEYWIYYRLSKAELLRRLEEKKQKAKDLCIAFIEKAKENQSNGNEKAAILNYLDAYTAIEEYPTNAIEFESEEGQIFLENKIAFELQKLLNEIKIDQKSDNIELTLANRFSNTILLEVKYQKQEVEELNFNYEYQNKYGTVNQIITTNKDGLLNIDVKANSLKEESIKYWISLDVNSIVSNRNNKSYLLKKLNSLILPSIQTKATIISPKIFVESNEKLMGKSNNNKVLKSVVISELSSEGIRIVQKSQSSDAIIEIKSDTKLQSKDENFTAVSLNYSCLIKNKLGKTLLMLNEGPFKGVSLDEVRASEKAYKKAESHIKRSGILKIKTSILDF